MSEVVEPHLYRDTLMDTARISMWAGKVGPGLKMKLAWVWQD
jgi:hypothetical protein